MTDQHPITPPPGLVKQWVKQWGVPYKPNDLYQHIATQAARWGYDQELEACCVWLDSCTTQMADQLRAARRPKPPSLKEQALEELNKWSEVIGVSPLETIRRALEQLSE